MPKKGDFKQQQPDEIMYLRQVVPRGVLRSDLGFGDDLTPSNKAVMNWWSNATVEERTDMVRLALDVSMSMYDPSRVLVPSTR